jgi:hypothetical protein
MEEGPPLDAPQAPEQVGEAASRGVAVVVLESSRATVR